MTTLEKLRQLIESVVGQQIKTPKDFKFLSERIYYRLHKTLSPTTLKRVWGYQLDEGPARPSTLDILCQFCGYRNWLDFASDSEQSVIQSRPVLNRCVYSDSLDMGDVLVLSWLPDRLCKIEYKGNHQFEVLQVENSKLRQGDTFSCDVFIENEPLSLYRLRRENQPEVCYSAGRRGGIRFEVYTQRDRKSW